MNLRSAVRSLRWSLAQRGPLATLRVVAATALRRYDPGAPAVHPFDQEHGTDTSGLIGGGRLGTGSPHDPHITAYVGVSPARLRTALDRWESTLAKEEKLADFVFADLGCGKGRALLLAAERPFREVLGVELNPALAATAEQNAAIWQQPPGTLPVIRVQCGDASEFQYPAAPCLVFLYNPFAPPVIQEVLDALERHVLASGRRVDVLYQNENADTPLRGDRRLKQLWTARLPLAPDETAADPVASPEDVTSLYRWIGTDQASGG